MTELDFTALDARVDARLAALTRRAAGGVSFAAGEDDGAAGLAYLLELARAGPDGDAALHFAADAGDEGPLARARRECAEFLRGIWRELTSLALVRTGDAAYTRVAWTGDATTAIAPDLTAAGLAAHAAAVQAALRACTRRLRLVTTIAAAAGKIAALIATPGAGVMALPVAYRCVRDVYDEWRASGSEGNKGGTSWQATT